MKKRIAVLFVLLAAFLPAGAQAQAVATDALNAFSFALFDQVLAQSPKETVVLSPFSADLALSLTANGARGETQQAMLTALHGTDLAVVNEANGNIVAQLSIPVPGVDLTIANSLWARGALNADFTSLAHDTYDAELGPLSGAPETINAWVSDKTHGKIAKLLDSVSDRTRVIIVNAVYFKGDWVKPFDKSLTEDQPFTLADGTTRTCRMMRHDSATSDSYDYYHGDDFEMVSLPYGAKADSGKDLAAILILPDRTTTPMAVEKTLGRTGWPNTVARLRSAHGSVDLPRFHSEYSITLNEALKSLGMAPAFDDTADFSGMADPGSRLKISDVIQKTYLDVDETGSTAAAATAVKVVAAMAMKPTPETRFHMVFDHPFLAAIVDRRSGAILFLAAINDPGDTLK